jgi:hypothetical protein
MTPSGLRSILATRRTRSFFGFEKHDSPRFWDERSTPSFSSSVHPTPSAKRLQTLARPPRSSSFQWSCLPYRRRRTSDSGCCLPELVGAFACDKGTRGGAELACFVTS